MQCHLQCCLIPCSVSFHAVLSHSMQRCLVPCSVVSFHALLSHFMHCCLIPCIVVSFQAVLSHSMQCCLIPCSVVSFLAVPHPCSVVSFLAVPHPCSVVSFLAVLSHSMQCLIHAELSHPCSVVSFQAALSHPCSVVSFLATLPVSSEAGVWLACPSGARQAVAAISVVVGGFLNMLRQLVPQVLSPVEVWARAGLSIVVTPACCRKLSTRLAPWGQVAASCGTTWVPVWRSRGRASGTGISPHYLQVVRFPFTCYS